MNNKSRKAKEFPSPDYAEILVRANHTFVRLETAYFALRGFADELDRDSTLTNERQDQLDVIVELLERRKRGLAHFLRAASALAGVEGE